MAPLRHRPKLRLLCSDELDAAGRGRSAAFVGGGARSAAADVVLISESSPTCGCIRARGWGRQANGESLRGSSRSAGGGAMIVNSNGRFQQGHSIAAHARIRRLRHCSHGKGTRIVASALVASPWSEAVKGMHEPNPFLRPMLQRREIRGGVERGTAGLRHEQRRQVVFVVGLGHVDDQRAFVWIAVGGRAVRAARANPARVLPRAARSLGSSSTRSLFLPAPRSSWRSAARDAASARAAVRRKR